MKAISFTQDVLSQPGLELVSKLKNAAMETVERKVNRVKDRESSPVDAELIAAELLLVQKSLAGDQDAFKVLFEKYYPKIFSAAQRILGNPTDAADLSQEAFMKAYKNLKSFQGNSSFYTWVYRILMNACIDLKRKSSTRYEVSTSEDYILGGDGSDPLIDSFHSKQWSPQDNLYSSEIRKIISEALAQLSSAHRDIIVYREVDGCSYEEISKILKCSVGTVMSRLFHARKNIVAILEKKLGAKADLFNSRTSETARVNQ